MRTMGLLISHKNNEKRRAILPEDVKLLRFKSEISSWEKTEMSLTRNIG